MEAFLIATIINNENKILKYRLARYVDNLDNLEVIDVSYEQLKYVIENNQIDVPNVTIEYGKLVGNGARIDRYTKLIEYNGGLNIVNNLKFVILRQIVFNNDTIGFIICNHIGVVKRVKTDDLLNRISTDDLANGKLVRTYTKCFISPISGNFKEVKITGTRNTKKDVKNRKDTGSKGEGDRLAKNKERALEIKVPTLEEFANRYEIENHRRQALSSGIANGFDKEAKVVALPEGIIRLVFPVGEMIGAYNVEVIKLPASYNTSLIPLDFNNLPKLKRIIFDDETNILDFSGLKSISKNIEYNIPANPKSIINYMQEYTTENNTAITLNFEKLRGLKEIRNSVGRITILNQVLELGEVNKVFDSFNEIITPSKFKIKFNAQQEILGGFCEFEADEIDFSEAVNLKRIDGYSFRDIKGLKKLDLSNCHKLETLGASSFASLKELEEVILPNTITYLTVGALSFCPNLTKLEIPNSVTAIDKGFLQESGVDSLLIPEGVRRVSLNDSKMAITLLNREEVYNSMFRDAVLDEINIPDDVWIIHRNAFYNCLTERITIPSKLKRICGNAFREFSAVEDTGMDLSICKELVEIEDSCFEESKLRWIILPDGLEIVGNRAFRQMQSLTWIYLPGSIRSIGSRVLQNTGDYSSIGVVVYTQKGSVADKYCKRNNIRVRYVNSAEEVFEIEKVEETDAKKLSKLKLIMGNDVVGGKILSPKYMGREVELYNLHIAASGEMNEPDVELIRDNTTNVNLGLIFNENDISEIRDCTNSVNLKFRSEMVAIMNFIIQVAPNFNAILTPQFFKYMRDNDMIESIDTWMACGDLKITQLYIINGSFKAILKILVEGNSIIFATLYKECEENGICMEIEPISSNVVRKPLDNKFVKNKGYTFNSTTISDMPSEIKKELKTAMCEQYIVVGCNGTRRRLADWSADNINEVYLYSIVSQKIVIVSPNVVAYSKKIRTKTIVSFEWVENLDIKDLNAKQKENIINMLFNQTGIEQLTKKIVYGESQLGTLIKSEGGYDKVEPCYEWLIAKSLNKSFSRNLIGNSLAITKETFDAIFDTPFFYKCKKKASTLDKLRIQNSFDIAAGRYKIIDYDLGKLKMVKRKVPMVAKNIIVLKDNLQENIDSITCYLSDKSIAAILGDIYNLYEPANGRVGPERVDNEEVDGTEYKIITSISYSLHNGSGTLNIAINKINGTVWMIGKYRKDIDDVHWYKLFRYKDLESALSSIYWWISGEFNENDSELKYMSPSRLLGSVCNNIALEGGPVEDPMKPSQNYEYIRELILRGYPNGYNLVGWQNSFYETLAKQPKDA